MSAKEDIASQIPDNYEQLKGSERRPSAKAKLLGPAAAEETLSVTIVLRRRPGGPSVPSHEYFAKTPPSRRRRMPLEEFVGKYGASGEDIEKVVEFAGGQNLSIVETHSARRTVSVSGTVAQMSKAFAVTLGRYQHEVPVLRHRGQNPITETYRGRDGFIYVPKELASIIVGVFGLDNRCVTKRNGYPGDPKYTNPVAIQTVMNFYNFPSFAAYGQTIGIVAPNSPPNPLS